MRIFSRLCAAAFAPHFLLTACDGTSHHRATVGEPPPISVAPSRAFSSVEEGLRLAASHRENGADSDAFAVLAAAHRRYQGNAAILSAYGRQALILGNAALAERALRRALEENPKDWRALSAIAIIEAKLGRSDGALAALGQAQNLSRGSASVLNNLGVRHLLDGQSRMAAAHFRQALIAPDLKQAHMLRIKRNLAVALAVSGDFQTADRLAERQLPRDLEGASGPEIAQFMGIGGQIEPVQAGWSARFADASQFRFDSEK